MRAVIGDSKTDTRVTDLNETRIHSRWPDRNINEVFEETACLHPDAPAILAESSCLSFGDLSSEVARLARSLPCVESSEQPRVALLFDQGPKAIAAALAVLKTGRIYVPLDPADPATRLERILQDSAAEMILTDAQNLEYARRLSAGSIGVKALEDIHDSNSDSPVFNRVSPDSLAYIFYTSGSTGHPKGVLQTHRNLLHFAGTYAETLGIAPGDRCSLLYTLSFSAANMDIYGALLHGATLCPFDVRTRGTTQLAAWVRRMEITVLHMVPSLFRNLAGNPAEDGLFESVRALDLGGEPVFARDVHLWRRRFSPRSFLVNHLAATEASVIAQHKVEAQDANGDGAVSAGRPAKGMEVRIVREDGSDATMGETGEIVLCSPFLSPGYWGNSEQTRQAYADDPGRPGWRIFKSGDRGWLDSEGRLFTAGRSDERVKIRGHSVDLAEVETALRGIEGVSDAVVVPVRSAPDEPPVAVAYVVCPTMTIREIRRKLAGILPSHKLPEEWNLLDELPRNATGKTDRKRLSGPDRPRSLRRRNPEPPRNADEAEVARIFAKVLGLEIVGRNEDFFELGGNSFGMAELRLELARSFAVTDIPLREFLEDGTVAHVAAFMSRLRASHSGMQGRQSLLVPLRESGSKSPLFLVHGARGQAFISPAFVEAVGVNQPLYGFQAKGTDGVSKPHRSVRRMATDYIAEMRKIQPKGPYFLGGICAGGIVAQEMACQLTESGERVAPLLLIDPPEPPGEASLRGRLRATLALWLARLPPPFSHPSRGIRNSIVETLRQRAEQGRIPLDPANRKLFDAALNVAIALRLAVLRHKIRPFSGEVMVLSSRIRLRTGWNSGKAWIQRFAASRSLTVVGEDHRDVLDPRNELFAATLRERLAAAHAAIERLR